MATWGHGGLPVVENGELIGRAAKPAAQELLVHAGNYDDYLLRFSFRLAKGYSCVATPRDLSLRLLGDRSGGLIPSAPEHAIDPFSGPLWHQVIVDGWNDVVIQGRGRETIVKINGLAADREDSAKAQAGQISLVLVGGIETEIRFRDLRVRRIRPGERPSESRPE